MLKPPSPTSTAATRVMKGNRRRDTKPELAVRSAVHGRSLRYRVDEQPLSNLRRRADLVFRPSKVAVFVDGCLWHGCPEHCRIPTANEAYWSAKIERNIARDRDTNARLQEAGWLPVRIWEHEDPDEAADRVTEAVRSRRPD
jgi:DNA mismatch endonuclease, patch repair protein